jgi:hypothetical protein
VSGPFCGSVREVATPKRVLTPLFSKRVLSAYDRPHIAKCHVWQPDRFSSENTGFSHLARVHLAM